MLDKIYKEEEMFDGTSDNFNFKVTIFYNKCRPVRWMPNVYIYNVFIRISSQTQMHYYANCGETSTFY